MKQFLTLGMKCKYCGCDDYHACSYFEDGKVRTCFWVEEELCSRCAEQKLKCEVCQHCAYWNGNGSPNRYYCVHPNNPDHLARLATGTLLCKTERHSEKFTRKKTPSWCPLK